MSKELQKQTMVQTVNVISMDKELLVPSIIGSFQDNSAGNIFAEELFISICKKITEQPLDMDNIECLLDDGVFETSSHKIDLTHSINNF